MTVEKFNIDKLRTLFGRRADDPDVVEIIDDPELISRSSYLGYMDFRDDGVSMMFRETVSEDTNSSDDPGALQVSAFHLHRKGHEGHAQYRGHLPNGMAFNDREHDVLKKLGEPTEVGGGEKSNIFNRSVPRWFRYSLGSMTVHVQMDAKGRVEMVTLYPSDSELGTIP